MTIQNDLQRRLLFILHHGLVEARLLALAGKLQQVFDLADALEQLPGWMASWKPEYLNDLKRNLETYSRMYPDAFGYLEFLDKFSPPTF